jgi:hypothetical protein
MRSAIFWINHKPSKSRVMVEFVLENRKIKLLGAHFVRGNVVDLSVVRSAMQHARNVLEAPPPIPFTG